MYTLYIINAKKQDFLLIKIIYNSNQIVSMLILNKVLIYI